MDKSFRPFAAIFFGYLSLVSGSFEVSFEEHLSVFSTIRHPSYEDGKMWHLARSYIKEKMQHYRLKDIREQAFNTSIGMNLKDEDDKINEVEGINIIAVREGQSKSGPIIVVGADYDTAYEANPLKNNGGGVACLLEVIRLMEEKINEVPYILNNTIIYVAFDLNTYEYYTSTGKGQSGSHFFVHQWLKRYLESEGAELLGAVILDSVTTYNTRNGSQQKTLLRDGFESAFPEAKRQIEARGSKGDFLGMVYDNRDSDNLLKEAFVQNYFKDRKAREFRLQEMEFQFNITTLLGDVLDLIQHQSHFPFWTNNEGQLPAFLLFDTDDDRSAMEEEEKCFSAHCDAEEFLTQERNEFMEMTTLALVRTLLELQATISKESKPKLTTTTKSPGNVGSHFDNTLLLLITALTFLALAGSRLRIPS